MPDPEDETLDARQHQNSDLVGAARTALEILNPHVYYDPKGEYATGLVIPTGHYMTVQVAVRSWGWEETEKIPEVRGLLERMNVALQAVRDESIW